MGFTDNLNKVQNPAGLFLKWKGGAEKVKEKITDASGNTSEKETVVGGKLVYWDKEKNEEVEVPTPLVFCPLEVTHQYTGFLPDKGRIWSGEILNFNEEIISVHLTGDSDSIIATGTYEEIKDKVFAAGGKIQTNVYAYCKQLGGIVRFCFAGSAKSKWKDYVKQYKYSNVFSCPAQIETGELETNALGSFIPPKFTIGKEYTDEIINKLKEQDNIVLEYLKYIAENKKTVSEPNNVYPDETIVESDSMAQKVENVKEVIPTAEEFDNDTIDLSEIPF